MHETVVAVGPEDPVSLAVERMQEEGYSQLPVIDDGIPVGSISDADVIHAGGEVGEKPVREIMSESFPTVSPDTVLAEIRSLLEYYKAVMVTRDGSTVGIITQADVAARLS
jgi:predicted transcriptional regulator